MIKVVSDSCVLSYNLIHATYLISYRIWIDTNNSADELWGLLRISIKRIFNLFNACVNWYYIH